MSAASRRWHANPVSGEHLTTKYRRVGYLRSETAYLDWSIKLDHRFREVNEHEELLTYARSGTGSSPADEGAFAIVENYEVLRSFTYFDVDIQFLDEYFLHGMCRMLQKLLAGKRLVVHANKLYSNHNTSNKQVQIATMVENLENFRCMRCNSVAFVGYEDYTQDLVDLIQSSEPVVETLDWYQRFRNDVLDQLPLACCDLTFAEIGYDDPRNATRRTILCMERAANHCDAIAYTRYKSDLTDLIVDFLTGLHNGWVREIRRKSKWLAKWGRKLKEKSEEEIVEYEKSVPTVLEDMQKRLDKVKNELSNSKASGSVVTDPKLFDELKPWQVLEDM